MGVIIAISLLTAVAVAAPNRLTVATTQVTTDKIVPSGVTQLQSQPTPQDFPITIAVVPTHAAHIRRDGNLATEADMFHSERTMALRTREKTVIYPATTRFRMHSETVPSGGYQIITETQVKPAITLVEMRDYTSLQTPITVKPGMPWPFGGSADDIVAAPEVNTLANARASEVDSISHEVKVPMASERTKEAAHVQARDWPTASKEEDDMFRDPLLDVLGLPQPGIDYSVLGSWNE